MTAREAGGRVLIRMPRSLHRDLQDLARGEGVSLNQFIVSALARVAGGAPSDESPTIETRFEFNDRLDAVEQKADAFDERLGEVEDWCPELDDRVGDLE